MNSRAVKQDHERNSDKQEVLSDDNEETNNVHIEEEINQQMNLTKLEDLEFISLEEIREN